MSQGENNLIKLMVKVHFSNFGVPQGSILFPVLYNLYIINLMEYVTYGCLKYADDSRLYKHSKPKILKKWIKEIDSRSRPLWSSNNCLVFDDDKSKLMLFSATHLSQRNNSKNNE